MPPQRSPSPPAALIRRLCLCSGTHELQELHPDGRARSGVQVNPAYEVIPRPTAYSRADGGLRVNATYEAFPASFSAQQSPAVTSTKGSTASDNELISESALDCGENTAQAPNEGGSGDAFGFVESGQLDEQSNATVVSTLRLAPGMALEPQGMIMETDDSFGFEAEMLTTEPEGAEAGSGLLLLADLARLSEAEDWAGDDYLQVEEV